MWMMLLLWQACATEAPLPLPPTHQAAPPPRGRMVAAGPDLHGFLVKPHSLPAPGVLLLVDDLDEASRQIATAAAISGQVALAIDATTPTARGLQYLTDLADTRSASTDCRRREGC